MNMDKKIDVRLYWVLFICWGLFGVHNLYSGRFGRFFAECICTLLFITIPVTLYLVIVDVIRLCKSKSDDNFKVLAKDL